MLKDSRPHKVRFFVQNDVNVVSGHGEYTGFTYTDKDNCKYCQIKYAVPGLHGPLYDILPNELILNLWVPICNVTEIDQDSDLQDTDESHFDVGNIKGITNVDLIRTLTDVITDANIGKPFKDHKIHITFNPESDDESVDKLLKGIKKLFGILFDDKWVTNNITHRSNEIVVCMCVEDCHRFMNSSVVERIAINQPEELA